MEQFSVEQNQDYHLLPVTEKQVRYARELASRAGVALPRDAQQSRVALSQWIDAQKAQKPRPSGFANYPSARQVAFAEKLARRRHRDIPRECFQDRKMMSRWIDSNL